MQCTTYRMKNSVKSILTAILVASSLQGLALSKPVLPVDTTASKEPVEFDPYFREPLSLTAPEWMRRIVENPSGVNFHEMQQLFNEWKANDINVYNE